MGKSDTAGSQLCRVKLQSHPLAFHHAPCECGSLFAEVLNRFIRVLRFRSINTDQTHTFTVFHNHRIAIDYTLHNTVITVNRSSAVGNATAEQVQSGDEKERDN